MRFIVRIWVLKRLFQLILMMSLIAIIYTNISLINIGTQKPSSSLSLGNSTGKVLEKAGESQIKSRKEKKSIESIKIKIDLAKLQDIRYDIRTTENVDEFINQVLDEFSVAEFDLLALKKRDFGAYFDSGIRSELNKVIQELGEFKEVNYREMFKDTELLKEMELAIEKESFFNRPLSEMISPNRSTPSNRPLRCENVMYEKELPTVSVIIPFYNEDLSLLLRTVHSVVNRTPPGLLKEIILVYDFAVSPPTQDLPVPEPGKYDKNAQKKHLKKEAEKFGKLERYLMTQFSGQLYDGKIRLLKTRPKDRKSKKRTGSIKAKLIGAHYAIGDVLFFLNSHCEVVTNWAEPLLARIQENPKTLVSPSIAPIDYATLHFNPEDNEYLATGFDFDGFTKIIYSRKSNHSSADPVKSPVLMSSIFAIDRHYFWDMGSFDSGMRPIGGEHLELSFRVWLCGGSVEVIPCSKIGHLFKKERPYGDLTGDAWTAPDYMSVNFARTSEVWLDDFKEIMMQTIDLNILEEVDLIYDGSLLRRKNLRNELNCSRDFHWYLKNVYPEKFAHLEESQIAGRMKHQDFPDLCLSTSLANVSPFEVRVYECLETENYHVQLFQIEFTGRMKLNKMFCESTLNNNNNMEIGIHCSDKGTALLNNDFWTWRNGTGQIINLSLGKCISIVQNRLYKAVVLEECNSGKSGQKWEYIEHVYLRVKSSINNM